MVFNKLVCRSRSSKQSKKEASFRVGVVKEDASQTSADSSIVTYETVDDRFQDVQLPREPHHLNLVSASSKDLGAPFSRMDVHTCLDTTCKFCKPQDITFLPRNPDNVDMLKRTMWTICHEESQHIPTCIAIDAVEHRFDKDSFKCTCGRRACGYFYEI